MSPKRLKTLQMGQGCLLDLLADDCGAKRRYSAVVTYDGKLGSEPFFIPPYWHKYHDEYITVLQGRMMVTVEAKTVVLSAGNPTMFIPRRHIHSFRAFDGEESSFEERNDPPGPYKALFFNDAFHDGLFPGFWRLLRSSYDGDTYGHLPLKSKFLDQIFVLVFGAIAKLFVEPRPTSL